MQVGFHRTEEEEEKKTGLDVVGVVGVVGVSMIVRWGRLEDVKIEEKEECLCPATASASSAKEEPGREKPEVMALV